MTNNRQKYWTDYPITELGDIPHKIAPVRECKVIRWLGARWLIAEAEGVQFKTKKFYVYTQKGRAGEVPFVERPE